MRGGLRDCRQDRRRRLWCAPGRGCACAARAAHAAPLPRALVVVGASVGPLAAVSAAPAATPPPPPPPAPRCAPHAPNPHPLPAACNSFFYNDVDLNCVLYTGQCKNRLQVRAAAAVGCAERSTRGPARPGTADRERREWQGGAGGFRHQRAPPHTCCKAGMDVRTHDGCTHDGCTDTRGCTHERPAPD